MCSFAFDDFDEKLNFSKTINMQLNIIWSRNIYAFNEKKG
jgi:hypothetical protein